MKYFFLVALSFTFLTTHSQLKVKFKESNLTYQVKFRDLARTQLHFSVTSKVNYDLETKEFEAQVHKWFGKQKKTSVLLGAVEDYKVGSRVYISIWRRF